MEVIHPRCCVIDIHKESVVACLRLQEGRRVKTEVRRFGTTTAELLRLHEWLSHAACTHVAMESTSVYLETGLQPPRGELRGSFGQCVPHQGRARPQDRREGLRVDREPPGAWTHPRQLHSAATDPRLARSHATSEKPYADRVKATNRVHKLLETANIKLANVVADVLGVSGRAMLDALVAGEADPQALAKACEGQPHPEGEAAGGGAARPVYVAPCLPPRADAHATGSVGGVDRAMRCPHPRGLEAVRTRDPAPADDRRCGTTFGGGTGVRDRRGHVSVLERRPSGFVGAHLSGQLRKRR